MFKKIILFLLLSVSIPFAFSLTSYASNITVENGRQFYLNYAEPATSDYEGYITLLVRNTSNGNCGVETFFWYTCAKEGSNISPCTMWMNISSTDIEFVPAGFGSVTNAFYSVGRFGITGKCFWQYASESNRYNVNYSTNGYEIVAYKYSGNVGAISGTPANGHTTFSVYFDENGSSVLLQEIINLLLSANDIESDILTNVLRIYNSVDGVEQSLVSIQTYLQSCDIRLSNIYWHLDSLLRKVDSLIGEQQESNTWLEKIFDFLEEKDEKDKEAATQQGNQSSKDVSDMIQDESSEGFKDSLGGLTASMSYSGTDCSWSFPTVKLPAIPGVMDEVTLIQEQDIDFSYWVNSLPSFILLLVQSVCTAALIVFCFKELYGAISYVLTLKGGGNSE